MVPAGREINLAGSEIAVPEAIVGTAGGKGIALLALLERSLARFDLREHLVEGADKKMRFASRLDPCTDRIVPVDRDVTGDISQLHQRIPNGGRDTHRGQKCDKNREKKHQGSDLRILLKPRAQIAQIEDEGD